MKACKILLSAIFASYNFCYALPAGRPGQISSTSNSSQDYLPSTPEDSSASEQDNFSPVSGNVEQRSKRERNFHDRAATSNANAGIQDRYSYDKDTLRKELEGAGLTKMDKAFVIDQKTREIMRKYDSNAHASSALSDYLNNLNIERAEINVFRGIRHRRLNNVSKEKSRKDTSKVYAPKDTSAKSEQYKAKRRRRQNTVEEMQQSTYEDVKNRLHAVKATYDLDPAVFAEREVPVRKFYGSRPYGQLQRTMMEMAHKSPKWRKNYRMAVRRLRRRKKGTSTEFDGGEEGDTSTGVFEERRPAMETSESRGLNPSDGSENIEPASAGSLKDELLRPDLAKLNWDQRGTRSKRFKALRKDGRALQKPSTVIRGPQRRLPQGYTTPLPSKRKHDGTGSQTPAGDSTMRPMQSISSSSQSLNSRNATPSSKHFRAVTGLSDSSESESLARPMAAKRPRQDASLVEVSSRPTIAKKTFSGAAVQRGEQKASIKPKSPLLHF